MPSMTDYDSRSTWDSDLDAGSTPARSIRKGRTLCVLFLWTRQTKVKKYLTTENECVITVLG